MSDFCHDSGSGTAFNYSMRHGQLTGGEAGKSNPSRSADLARPAAPIAIYVRPRIERKADSVLGDPDIANGSD
jgi:hypothetical protein